MTKLPDFTSVDLSGLDASKLAALDDKLVAVLRDTAYITIGFGVLAFQRAQVRRHEAGKAMTDHLNTSKAQMEEMLSTVESRIAELDEHFDALDAKLDTAVEKIEEHLPEQAAAILVQAHELARVARKQVRGLIRSAA